MFLRRLSIRGFKSFADRTVFDFTPGVAVIVGPNGSGKSNLVDAIAWVLGEQGAKTLRGGKMEDVIFAGTPTRPALGRAEVELTIDNSSGILPIEFTEVTVRRTLFRTGESEYAINDVPSRLLDVQELLSDSGIGRELHTIVGQGQLDDILQGKPEDRRAVLEEAAGLLKHRKRKEKAVRKLERVDADVERLMDVTAELRRQIRPLEKQAELAKRASEIDAELREVSLKLWLLDFRAINGEQDEDAEARAVAAVQEFVRAVADASTRAEGLERSLAEASRSAEAMLGTEYRLSGLRDRYEGLARFADERATHLRDLAAREPRDDAPTQDALAAGHEAVEATRAAREEAEAEARRAETDRAAVHSAREEAARAREEVVHLHGERAALRAAIEGSEDERRRLQERRARVADGATRAAESLAEVRAELHAFEAEEAEVDRLAAIAEERRAAFLVDMDGCVAAEREAERRTETIAARKSVVEEEVRAAPDPAGSLVGSRGISGRLIEHVRARDGYERALRAALGPLADAALAETRADALACIEGLKRGGGRAAIATPGAPVDPPVPMGVRALTQVIEAVGPHADLVRGLLSGVALAESLSEAAAISEANPGLIVVTTDGDRLGPNIVQGGAPIDARNPREELRRIDASLAEATDGLATARRATEHARAQLDVSAAECDTFGARLEAIDSRVAGATGRLGQIESDSNASAREDAVLSGRLTEVEERLVADTERLGSVEARLSRAVATEPQMDVETMARIERMAAERALHLGEATERERAAVAALREMQTRTEHVAAERARYEAGRATWLAGAQRASDVAATARLATERLAHWVEHAREARTGGEARRRALEDELTTTRARAREKQQALEQARQLSHEADLRRAERNHRLAALAQKLRDEYQMSPEEASEAVRAETDELEELRRRAAGLERKLTLLGRVNPIAMEQFQGMVDRHAFLTEQVNDLKRSRRDLADVVGEVDRKIVEIFSSAFTDVAREFDGVFARLFPGGEGRLTLTDPDDLLNSGIEVEARPAGKRVKRVSLLSGGERSLVAVALLFSVFRARPSPFYLLDEVEPALDDVNLHRFLAIASEFREQSQLLIVTHQKRTMEIGDAIYGISMGGEGVSKVICERLDQPEESAQSQITLDA